MPPHRVRFALLLAAAPTVLACAGPAPAAAPPIAAIGRAAAADDATLVAARDRSARAQAAVDTLRAGMGSTHVADGVSDVDRAFGLEALRAEYLEVQRRVAGYRATLGDQHPTLVAAEQVLTELRAQVLDGTRRALASAEREAADARAAVAAVERRRAADAATAPRLVAATTEARPAAAPPSAARRTEPREAEAIDREPTGSMAPGPAVPPSSSDAPLATVVALAALAACAGGALSLARRRKRRAGTRRVEPLVARGVEATMARDAEADAARSAAAIPAAAPFPVLARLALPDAADETNAARPDAADGAASALHATLRAAFGGAPEARMTVLVAPVAGLSGADADAVGLALALAAAAAGRRPALMEARPVGRLRAGFVPPAALPMLIEAGGVTRTLYRLGGATGAVAVLPSDAGEAEAAAEAQCRPETIRLRGLDAFDTMVLVGDDAEALAHGADLLVMAAPDGLAPAAIAAAAPHLLELGLPCGAVQVARPLPVSASSPVAPSPRRRFGPGPVLAAARWGLRGSFEPSRRAEA